MQQAQVLLAHGYLELPEVQPLSRFARSPELATLLANFAHYGFVPGTSLVYRLGALLPDTLALLWAQWEPGLKAVTGADRPMAQHVVYKNFPQEVLDKTQAEYWFAQLFMYLGAPNEWFTAEELARPPVREPLRLQVLTVAPPTVVATLYEQKVRAAARWSDPDREYAVWLCRANAVTTLNLGEFGFRENGIQLAAALGTAGVALTGATATDVARLAAAWSGQDVSLRNMVRFARFQRPQRRALLALLEATPNLEADLARRPAVWKQLLRRLRPGDYACPRVSAAYAALYQGHLPCFGADVEARLAARDATVLPLLQERPGEFARRLHQLYGLFGAAAVRAFATVAPALPTMALVKLKGYLRSIPSRSTFMYPPRGNWARAQVAPNTKVPFQARDLARLLRIIDATLARQLRRALPQGVALAAETASIRLPDNDAELAPYGRGTVFFLPDHVRFVRTASYWQAPRTHNVWFDNSWNFFDANWQERGVCCWNQPQAPGALLSGDPTNSKEEAGRACQLIDLYPEQLLAAGIRFAVWSVLCYSRIAFAEVDEVLATLQWGTDASAGELYEPARAQLVFPLKGRGYTKFVALLDLEQRRLVYLDANLRAHTDSAGRNGLQLQTQLPAYLQYLAAQPTVADLLEPVANGAVPVLYSDAAVSLAQNQPAYAFRRENPDNAPHWLTLEQLLA